MKFRLIISILVLTMIYPETLQACATCFGDPDALATKGISYIDIGVGPGIALGLLVASVKGSLVACYFMHLLDEKKTILWTLFATVISFMILIFVPLSSMISNAGY